MPGEFPDVLLLKGCHSRAGASPREFRQAPIPLPARRDPPVYIFGGKLAGSITYHTLFTPCPAVSPAALSPTGYLQENSGVGIPVPA